MESNHSGALATTKSSPSSEPTKSDGLCLVPTQGDVASHFLTEDEWSSLAPNLRAVLVCLVSLIYALQFEVLSGDIWWMAMHKAISDCEKMGIPVEETKAVFRKLEEYRKQQFRRNPMSTMF